LVKILVEAVRARKDAAFAVSVTLAEFKADEYRGHGERIAFVGNGGSHPQLLREYDGDIIFVRLTGKVSLSCRSFCVAS